MSKEPMVQEDEVYVWHFPLNSLFPEDSVSTDSDEDVAEELDEFFRFMIVNDLSGEEEEEDSSFMEDEEREGSISATDLFAEIDVFDDGYLSTSSIR